jgi:hypothetical protein
LFSQIPLTLIGSFYFRLFLYNINSIKSLISSSLSAGTNDRLLIISNFLNCSLFIVLPHSWHIIFNMPVFCNHLLFFIRIDFPCLPSFQ